VLQLLLGLRELKRAWRKRGEGTPLEEVLERMKKQALKEYGLITIKASALKRKFSIKVIKRFKRKGSLPLSLQRIILEKVLELGVNPYLGRLRGELEGLYSLIVRD